MVTVHGYTLTARTGLVCSPWHQKNQPLVNTCHGNTSAKPTLENIKNSIPTWMAANSLG